MKASIYFILLFIALFLGSKLANGVGLFLHQQQTHYAKASEKRLSSIDE